MYIYYVWYLDLIFSFAILYFFNSWVVCLSIRSLFILFIYLFIYLFIHGKKIHQVHKCLKIPKPKNTNRTIITLIYSKATYRPDFHERRVFKNIDGEGV